jgi:DNA replication ATP-dependent helicase Dna2
MKPEIRQHSLHDQLEKHLQPTNQEDRMPISTMEKILNNVNLVAATCLGARDQILSNNKGTQGGNGSSGSNGAPFDFCIVDEASQIHEPVCIGPLLIAKRFVLVGDPHQLSAVVQSRKARELGMAMSLFERLANAHPHAVSRLTDQYRMNKDITTLANELVYHGALRCGSTKVSLRKLAIPVQILNDAIRLPLPVLEGTTTGTTQQHWMKEVLNAQRSVVFINTDSLELGPLESRGHKNGTKQEQTKKQRSKRKTVMVNEMEVSLSKLICRGLIRCGISQKDVGVISPYRSQLKLLSHSLQLLPQVEVNTVDQYQGRDKDCIVFSLVRSNLDGQIGTLLGDWRRVNVAFTRAKSKLIVLGSLSTLEKAQDEHIAAFVQCIKKRDWILHLPKNGHLMYPTLK